MTESEIALAKARASDVLDGFVQVRIQQARDVVKLAEELRKQTREMQRTIDEMKREMEQRPRQSNPGEAPEFFNKIFGGKL